MRVKLSKEATKQYKKINEPLKSRLKKALFELAAEPPKGDIKKLSGCEVYRLRIGDYRLIFHIENDTIVITHILTRGHSYKGGVI